MIFPFFSFLTFGDWRAADGKKCAKTDGGWMINQGETNVDSDNIAAAEYKYKYTYKKTKQI